MGLEYIIKKDYKKAQFTTDLIHYQPYYLQLINIFQKEEEEEEEAVCKVA